MSPITSAGVTFAVVALEIKVLLRLQVLDHPNERSSHQVPTPRGGGLAVALGMLTGLDLVAGLSEPFRMAAITAVVGFGVIGLLDDVRGIPVLQDFALQVLVGGLVLVWLLDPLDGSALWEVLFGVGCLLWLVAYVNAFNFMDGINGIAVAQAVVAGAAWWAIGRDQGVPALAGGGAVVAAAALAFLPYNLPRAVVFLGDVGSYLLGGVLGALAIVGLRGAVAGVALAHRFPRPAGGGRRRPGGDPGSVPGQSLAAGTPADPGLVISAPPRLARWPRAQAHWGKGSAAPPETMVSSPKSRSPAFAGLLLRRRMAG